MKTLQFDGFKPELSNFLSELNQLPTSEWFKTNRNRYTELFLNTARALITELAPFLQSISPAIHTEPKINKTIKKQFHDTRFNPVTEVRDYFLLHFGRFSGDTEFFIYLNKDEIQIGLDINNKSAPDNYFRKNRQQSPEQLETIFSVTQIKNQYSLYKLGNPPELIVPSFDFTKHRHLLNSSDRLIFQKVYTSNSTFISTRELLHVVVKIFSELTPLYHFSTLPL